MPTASREAFFAVPSLFVCVVWPEFCQPLPDLLSAISAHCHNVTERGEIVAAHHHVLLAAIAMLASQPASTSRPCRTPRGAAQFLPSSYYRA